MSLSQESCHSGEMEIFTDLELRLNYFDLFDLPEKKRVNNNNKAIRKRENNTK